MRNGKLKERQLKLVHKQHDGIPGHDRYYYAEAGTGVTWNGREGNPEYYGGRRVLWCALETGETVGLESHEVEWTEE